MWHPRVERRAHAVLALLFQCALVVPLLPLLKLPSLFFPGALLEDLLLLCGLAALLFGPEPILFSGAPRFLEKSICLNAPLFYSAPLLQLLQASLFLPSPRFLFLVLCFLLLPPRPLLLSPCLFLEATHILLPPSDFIH